MACSNHREPYIVYKKIVYMDKNTLTYYRPCKKCGEPLVVQDGNYPGGGFWFEGDGFSATKIAE